MFPKKCVLGIVEKLLKYYSKLDAIKVSFETEDYKNIIFCSGTPHIFSNREPLLPSVYFLDLLLLLFLSLCFSMHLAS